MYTNAKYFKDKGGVGIERCFFIDCHAVSMWSTFVFSADIKVGLGKCELGLQALKLRLGEAEVQIVVFLVFLFNLLKISLQ